MENICKWKLVQNLGIAADKAFSDSVPKFETREGILHGLYYLGYNDGYLLSAERFEKSELDEYRQRLTEAGYSLYFENVIEENHFYTYRGKDAVVHICDYAPIGHVKIATLDADANLPSLEKPTFDKKAEPFVMQPSRCGAMQTAPGTSVIFRLSDGSFIIVDGGPYDENDCDALMQFLRDNSPNGEKPVVSAWMITHAHSDHMNLANAFIPKYKGEFELKSVAYNFPHESVRITKEILWQNGINKFISGVKDNFPNAVHYVFHAGQKFYIADAEIEILFTHEDLYPNEIRWGNHTSSAWSVTVNGIKTMILGDCEKTLCQQMADCYGEYLKSDICQLSHHGFNGACMDLYRYIDPSVCFWSCDKWRFSGKKEYLEPDGTRKPDMRTYGLHSDGRPHESYDFNYWIRNMGERTHYHAQENGRVSLENEC